MDAVFDAGGIDKGLLLDMFAHINKKLKARHLSATIHVYGGCAMMLTCLDTRRSWDFDFIFEGKPVRELSKILREIEAEYHLPASAFDKTMGPLIAAHFLQNDTSLFQTMSNLAVRLCSPKQLLAMKLFSARMGEDAKDFDDALELCKLLKITTRAQMEQVLAAYIKPESVESENSKPTRLHGTDIFINYLEEALRA